MYWMQLDPTGPEGNNYMDVCCKKVWIIWLLWHGHIQDRRCFQQYFLPRTTKGHVWFYFIPHKYNLYFTFWVVFCNLSVSKKSRSFNKISIHAIPILPCFVCVRRGCSVTFAPQIKHVLSELLFVLHFTCLPKKTRYICINALDVSLKDMLALKCRIKKIFRLLLHKQSLFWGATWQNMYWNDSKLLPVQLDFSIRRLQNLKLLFTVLSDSTPFNKPMTCSAVTMMKWE